MNRESEMLKKWTLDTATPTNFNSVVWRRIEERRQISGVEAIRLWINQLFAKQSVAVAYLSLAVVFGLAVAQVQASKVIQERASQIQARYVQSVDPYFPRVTQ
jgi:hypothetical protein